MIAGLAARQASGIDRKLEAIHNEAALQRGPGLECFIRLWSMVVYTREFGELKRVIECRIQGTSQKATKGMKD
jgi:hypothetical protein